MDKYTVGNKYSEFAGSREKSTLLFDGKNIYAIFLWKNPSEEEISMVLNNEPYFQLFSKNQIIFLLIKFGNMNWTDIVYVAQENFNQKYDVEIVKNENQGYKCSIFIANLNDGKLLVNKVSVLSHGLSKAFYYAHTQQNRHPIKNMEEKINSIRASFYSHEMARLSLGR